VRPLSALPKLRSTRGMSMAELIAVLGIIGLTTAIVAPKLDVPHYAIDGAMRSVGTALMAAQRDAVASQHNVIVAFDAASGGIRIHWDADNDEVEDSGERIRVIPLEEGVTFGRAPTVPARSFGTSDINFSTVGSDPAVIFRRNGSASESGGLYLTSVRSLRPGVSRPNDTRAIEFERATGRAEWFRYQGAWRRGF
jgi:type II secretory pathway pseudopilin PulG